MERERGVGPQQGNESWCRGELRLAWSPGLHTDWKVELRKQVMPMLMMPAGLFACAGLSSAVETRGECAGDGNLDCGAERLMVSWPDGWAA